MAMGGLPAGWFRRSSIVNRWPLLVTVVTGSISGSGSSPIGWSAVGVDGCRRQSESNAQFGSHNFSTMFSERYFWSISIADDEFRRCVYRTYST